MYKTRLALLERIKHFAPVWADAIAQRKGVHGVTQPAGNPTAAWRWRQWHDELDRRAQVSISDLQDRMNATQDELRSLAASIIEHETWAAQRERTDLSAQQALIGYVKTIGKIGAGTGKRVPLLLREARHLLGSARRAVPEGKSGRLAIECDGEKYHTAEQLQHDIDREAILRRLGWKFARIRGSVFFRDPDAAMAPIFAKLDQLGIEPLGTDTIKMDESDVIDRIKRKAESLRAQWQQEKKEATASEDEIHRQKRPNNYDRSASDHSDPSPAQSKMDGASRVAEETNSATTKQPRQYQGEPNTRQLKSGQSDLNKPVATSGQAPSPNPLVTGDLILETLLSLEPKLQDQTCKKCSHPEQLLINKEGIVLSCKKCANSYRVDIDVLQHLADRRGATCFLCASSELKSVAKSFGNVLVCPNHHNNTWQGVSGRIDR